jgi:hypothetical protein
MTSYVYDVIKGEDSRRRYDECPVANQYRYHADSGNRHGLSSSPLFIVLSFLNG